MDHAKNARELFESGYNCAQSVLAAFCEETGLDERTALMLSSTFGGGMGRLREVCGAVSAMFMVEGLTNGYADSKDDAAKTAVYARVQELAARFRDENGSIICRELLDLPEGPQDPTPEHRSAAYYQKRPCAQYVACAARLMEQELARRRSVQA